MPKMKTARVRSSSAPHSDISRTSLNASSRSVRETQGVGKLASEDVHALDQLGQAMLEEGGSPSVELLNAVAQLFRDYASMIEQFEPKLAKRFLNASRALDPWEQRARMREFARVRRERDAREPKTRVELQAFARQCDQLSREIGQRGAFCGAPTISSILGK